MNVKISYKEFEKQVFKQYEGSLLGAYVSPSYDGTKGAGRVMHSAAAVSITSGKCVAVWVKDSGVVWHAKHLKFTKPERK